MKHAITRFVLAVVLARWLTNGRVLATGARARQDDRALATGETKLVSFLALFRKP